MLERITDKTIVTEENGQAQQTTIVDDVWVVLRENGTNYRSLGWIACAILMMKTQIGLGVLSIPQVFDNLGLIPGIFCLLSVACITTWSSYVVGVFKLNHPEVYGIDDVGKMLAGRIQQYILAGSFVICSGMLGISIGLNVVSNHATCTAVWVPMAALFCACLASIETLGRIGWLAWVGTICILISSMSSSRLHILTNIVVFTLTISVGLHDRPVAAPTAGEFVSDFKLFGKPTFLEAASSLATLVFAYAGTPAFFAIVSEMKDPKLYTRSLLTCQTVVTFTSLVIGSVVYYFCGSWVASPALGSAGPIMKKVCFAFALPGLIVTTLMCIHIPAKYLFVRLLKGCRHLSTRTPIHFVVWFSCTFGAAVIAYIIASSIPVFGGLVSLVGGCFGTLMSFKPMGLMWLYDNWNVEKHLRTKRWMFMIGFSSFVVLVGCFLIIAGSWGAIGNIIKTYKISGGSGAWSCADNSFSASGGH